MFQALYDLEIILLKIDIEHMMATKKNATISYPTRQVPEKFMSTVHNSHTVY